MSKKYNQQRFLQLLIRWVLVIVPTSVIVYITLRFLNFSYTALSTSIGSQTAYFENGKIKFDFFYINEKSQGLQKQWYQNGQQYIELNYDNDTEVGMQKAWRENGKLFINYEVKDGLRYGLQKSALCYTLKNEKLK